MKRILLLICCLMTMSLQTYSQQTKTVRFAIDGNSDTPHREKINRDVTNLLTVINSACDNGKDTLNLTSVHMDKMAENSLQRLWSNMHFRCNRSTIIRPILKSITGFEVRGISITLRPLDDTYHGDIDKELVVCFDNTGTITAVHTALDNNMYSNIMTGGNAVEDMARRNEIVKFVEDFRSYYEEKNLDALRNVFSEDALIITGKVIPTRKTGDVNGFYNQISYTKQTKEQYLEGLKNVFAKNRFIKVGFSDIRMVKHPAKANFYGVELRQDWESSSGYHDEGYVFLLWQFRDGQEPLIHVRTWQPSQTPNDDKFDLNYFDFE